MRILLYTGKGGVGKTSISAATALRCSDLGYRTAVLSTDPAHSLGDSFDQRIGSELKELAPNLWAQEIDLLSQMDEYWGRVQDYLNAIFSWQGMEGLVAEETAILPGMEELASLMQITSLADSGDYDVIIIDAAPTGSTLQLLSFPDIARWYIEKVFPLERKVMQIARPIVKRVSDIPLPDEELFDSIEELVTYLERMSELLGDGDVSSMRVVLNPEKMVVKEAQRAYTYLNLYGYSVDAVVCNRVFPAHLTDSYFDTWKSAQAKNLELINECFHPLPVFQIPFYDQEVVGMAMLRQMATTVYGEEIERGGVGDPTGKYYVGKPQEIFREDGHYVLSLALPLVDRDEINLHRSVFDELIIHIGNWKRNVSLPLGLAKLEIAGARYEADRLNILFALEETNEEIPAEELTTDRWQALKTRFSA
jgi:arsenite-transporting ATPase